MRGFLVVFAHFSGCAEAASQAYSKTLNLSTSKQYFFLIHQLRGRAHGMRNEILESN